MPEPTSTKPQAPLERRWETATDRSTGRFFVRDPITDEITPVERDEAEDLILRKGYAPVDEASAGEYHKAELYKKYGEENPLEAVTTGLTRGLTGGLEDLAMGSDEAKLRQAVVDEHPWLAGGSELLSTIGGALLGGESLIARATPVNLLAKGSDLIASGARKIVPSTAIARAAGTAVEGAAYGGIQAARESHMYGEPLTVQQVASNMLGGAIFAGAVGGTFGLFEKKGASMGTRMAQEQEKRLTAALKPGLSDEELVAVLKAEGIDVTPSALKVFQAGLYNDKDITPELLQLAADSGPVGKALRARLGGAGQDRAAAEARLAEALQAQYERDDYLREHYGGRLKREHFARLVDDSPESAMEKVFKADNPADIEALATHVTKADAATKAEVARALGVSEGELADKIRTGLATRDLSVQKAVADLLQEVPVKVEAANNVTLPEAMTVPGALSPRGSYTQALDIAKEAGDFPALEKYASSSVGINGYMRKRAEGAIDAHPLKEAERIKLVNEIRRLRDAGAGFSGDVFRGEAVSSEKLAALKEGGLIDFPSVMSTSKSEKTAREFATPAYDEESVLFKIRQKEGAVLPWEDETEVVLAPGKFRVLRIYDGEPTILYKGDKGHSVKVVELEHLPESGIPTKVGPRTELGVGPESPDFASARGIAEERAARDAERKSEQELRDSAGFPEDASLTNEQRDARIYQNYPGIRTHALELVEKMGADKAVRSLAKQYPPLRVGELYRVVVDAQTELERRGFKFGKMTTEVLERPANPAIPEAPVGTRTPMWRRQAVDALKDARERFEWLTSMPKGYISDKKYGDVAKMLDVFAGAEEAIARGNKLDAFLALDYVKKRLGQAARPGEVLPVGAMPAQKAREAYENMRVVLEDEGLWGRGANAQKAFNERLHKRLARRDVVEGRYMTGAGKPHPRDPWREQKRVDVGGIRRMVDEMSEDGGAPVLQALAEHIDEGGELNGLMKEYFDLEPGALRAVNEADAAGKEARQALKEALDAAKREKQMATLQGRHGPSYGARGLLWAVLGGVPGAMAAQAADAVMNPGRAIYWRGVLERFANTTESKVGRSIANIMANGPRALLDALSGPATMVAKSGARAKHIFDDVMSEDYLSRVKAYNATIKELSGVAAGGEDLNRRIKNKLADTAMVNPQFLPALRDQAMRTAQALLMHAPPQPNNDLWGDEVAPVSNTAMADFFRKYEIAVDPTKLLDLAQSGELMPGDIEIAKQVAPEMVAWIQQQTVQSLAGTKPSYETRVQVSLLMDMPLDPTMNPEYIGAQQQLHTNKFAQKAPRRSPSTFEDTGVQVQYRSAADRTESGEVPQ